MPTLPGHTDPGNVDSADTLDPTWGDNVRASINNNAAYLAKEYVLDVDTTLVTVANTVTETTIFQYTLPANTLGASGNIVSIKTLGEIENAKGSMGITTFQLYYGTGSVYSVLNIANGDDEPFELKGTLIGTGATNTQWLSLHGSYGFIDSAETENNREFRDTTMNKDSTTDLVIKITMTHNAAHSTYIGRHRHTVVKINQS